MLNYNNPARYMTKTGGMNALSNFLANTLGYSLSVTNSNAAVTSGSYAVYWIHSVGSKYLMLWTYNTNQGNTSSNPSESSLAGSGFVVLESTTGFSGDETSLTSTGLTNKVNTANGTTSVTNYIGNTLNQSDWDYYGGNLWQDSSAGFAALTLNRGAPTSWYSCGFIVDKKDDKLMIISDLSSSYSAMRYLCIDNNSNVWWGKFVTIYLSSRGQGIMLQGFNRCFGTNPTDSTGYGVYDYTGYNIFADSKLFFVASPEQMATSQNHLIGLSDGSLYFRLGRYFAYQISS